MKVKICGVTHPEDAELAASLGADYIGIIFAERSKRKVSYPMAKAIAKAAKDGRAIPVGVFVEQTAEQIVSICEQTGIRTVQLHGSYTQEDLQILSNQYTIFYSLSVEKNGVFSQIPVLPIAAIPIYDNLTGGTGKTFDWNTFSPPKNTPWFLAGGLNPTNVTQAINLLQPTGVDVATGVEFPNITRKDPHLVKAFIQAAKKTKERI